MTKEHFWLQKCHQLQTKQILQYVEDRNLVYRNSLAPIKHLKQNVKIIVPLKLYSIQTRDKISFYSILSAIELFSSSITTV